LLFLVSISNESLLLADDIGSIINCEVCGGTVHWSKAFAAMVFNRA
jgi:hypothetical protein